MSLDFRWVFNFPCGHCTVFSEMAVTIWGPCPSKGSEHLLQFKPSSKQYFEREKENTKTQDRTSSGEGKTQVFLAFER